MSNPKQSWKKLQHRLPVCTIVWWLVKSVLVLPPAYEQRFDDDVSMGRISLIFFVLGEFWYDLVAPQ